MRRVLLHVRLHRLGPKARLIPLEMWDPVHPSPSTPMTQSTFPTMTSPMATSSMQPIRPVLGPTPRLTQLERLAGTPPSPSTQTMLCIFPIMMLPIRTSNMQATCNPPSKLVLEMSSNSSIEMQKWDDIPPLPLIQTAMCTFPTMMPSMVL